MFVLKIAATDGGAAALTVVEAGYARGYTRGYTREYTRGYTMGNQSG
jgi:hypothetical protein